MADPLEESPAAASEHAAAGAEHTPKKKRHDYGPLIAVTSLLGVVVAWLTYQHSKNNSNAAAAAAAANPYGANISGATGAGNVGGAAPEAIPNDVANLTGQVSQLSSQLGALTDPNAPAGFAGMLANLEGQIAAIKTPANPSAGTGIPTSPAHVPTFRYGSAAAGLHYTRDIRTGAIYQIGPDGTGYHLNPQQYAALGRPKYVDYGTRAAPPRKAAPAKKKT